MSKRDPQQPLRDMLDHATECLQFMDDVSREALAKDRTLALAVVKLIEIVGEAATRIPRERRDQIAGIPWADIIQMRNRLIHVYDDVDIEIVWQTVHDDLPPLVQRLEQLLSEGGGS